MTEQALATTRTQPQSPVEVLKAEFLRKRIDVEAMMREQGGESTPQTDRIFAVAITKYRAILNGQKPSDKEIDPFSVVDCVLQAAQIGLEAGSDQAYLVPYNGRVSLIVSPRGLIDLAFRHPQVRDVNAAVVRAGDFFEYELGDEPRIRHRKNEKVGEKLGDLTHVYAVMTLASGGKIRAVLTASEIAFYRKFSKSTSGPWYDNTAAMWEKTALKRMMAKGPRSPQMAAAMVENELGHYVPPGSEERRAPAPRTVSFLGEGERPPASEEPKAAPIKLEAREHPSDAEVSITSFTTAPAAQLLAMLGRGRALMVAGIAEQAFAARLAVLLGSIGEEGYNELRGIAHGAELVPGSPPDLTLSRAFKLAAARLDGAA